MRKVSALPSTSPRHMSPRHTRTIRTRGGGGFNATTMTTATTGDDTHTCNNHINI